MNRYANDFEELDIFKKARRLVTEIYELTKREEFYRDYALRDQIRRAGISVMSNIAEGFDRGDKEFKKYLNISRGSCMEIKSQLIIARDLNYIEESDYEDKAEQCRVLSAMTKSLMNYLESQNDH